MVGATFKPWVVTCNILRKMVEAQFSDLVGKPLRPGRWEQLGLVACGTGLAPLLQVVLSLALQTLQV